jgi:glycosyltransferase involved in cell wall biosynthesis
MSHFPRISIVTPSFNQAQFLEATLLSVMGQEYPNLEYIVMDGGSTDGSADILQLYGERFAHWQSAKDKGQSDAINAGFARATGDILAWLNSDDLYLPHTLRTVAANLDLSKAQILFGNCLHFFDNDSGLAWGSSVANLHASHQLKLWDYLIQPSTFWTRKAWEAVGQLNQNLHFTFDWEWFLRAQGAGVEFKPITSYLSVYRFHDAHKSGIGGSKRIEEILGIYERFAGKNYRDALAQVLPQRERLLRLERVTRRLRIRQSFFALARRTCPALRLGITPQDLNDMLQVQ